MDSSIANRERKSNRFIMCFKSGDNYGDDDDNVVVVNNKCDGDCGSNVNNALFTDDNVVVDNGKKIKKKKKKKSKFFRVLKGFFFDSSLAKKIQAKKTREGSFRSSSSTLSTKSTSRASLTDEDNENQKTNETKFSVNPTTTTTIEDASKPLNFKVLTTEPSKATKSNSLVSKHWKINWNFGVCMFLVSLLVLLLWGKVYAIFCTSACLLVVSRRSIARRERVTGAGVSDFDSVEYKKRVIMEGMLGRKHSKFL